MQEMRVTRKEERKERHPIRTKNATKHHFGANKLKHAWCGMGRRGCLFADATLPTLNERAIPKRDIEEDKETKEGASRQLPERALIWRSITEGLSMCIRQSAKMCCRLLCPQTGSASHVSSAVWSQSFLSVPPSKMGGTKFTVLILPLIFLFAFISFIVLVKVQLCP